MNYISSGQTNSISKKRIYKKIWIFFIVLFIMLLLFISSTGYRQHQKKLRLIIKNAGV